MEPASNVGVSETPRTLRKAVTTLAIAAQNESLTRTARMAYNVMIYKAQNMVPDAEGGFSAPLSEIIKDFDSTTRNSTRVRGYIEQMCTTLVRWFPLSRTDEPQANLDGIEPAPLVPGPEDQRVFTLMSEARFVRKSGEQWVTWFFPPTIREMVIDPERYARLDIPEMSLLSHYASVALYEICARYKDSPGGLTNRGAPSFWAEVLRPDPADTKPREWRKFKNETLKPALAEINQHTSLNVELLEERKGRAVVSVQFQVRRREGLKAPGAVTLSLVERAAALRIKERDLDALLEEFEEGKVEQVILAMERRNDAQPSQPIKRPVAYLLQSLRNGTTDSLFNEEAAGSPGVQTPVEIVRTSAREQGRAEAEAWEAEKRRSLDEALNALPPRDLDRLAEIAHRRATDRGIMTPALQKRFSTKLYRSSLVWNLIRDAYAGERE